MASEIGPVRIDELPELGSVSSCRTLLGVRSFILTGIQWVHTQSGQEVFLTWTPIPHSSDARGLGREYVAAQTERRLMAYAPPQYLERAEE